jgi:selenocysteine-specific elongation factor
MAGHVDHGKSSVIKALTGITTARYREEIEREITIDIGFAHINIEGAGPVSIIDVPGHEDFVHNMLAGIFGARIALLVIAASEGIMPQTVEHFDILNFCGVSKIIVVLNKCDLASGDDIEYRKMEIEDFLKDTKFQNSKIINFSSADKKGSAGLIAAVREEISALSAGANGGGISGEDKLTLYPIDRVFEKAGFGQILTGTLMSGRLKTDEIYKIMPGGECKVRSIESHSAKFSEVSGGLRAALNITKTREAGIARGSFLVSGEIACPYRILTVKLTASKNLKHKIKSGANIKFYFYSACYAAKLRLLENAELEAGVCCFAQIVFTADNFALILKPFIIRTHTDEETIGGGIILNCHNRLVKNKKAVLESVSVYKDARVEDENKTAELFFSTEIKKRGFIEINIACAAFMAVREKIIEIISLAAPEDKYFLIKDRLITGEKTIQTFKALLIDKLSQYLNLNKLSAGLAKAELIKLFAAKPDEDDALFYSYIIDSAASENKVKNADGIITLPASGGGGSAGKKLDGDSEIIRRKIIKSFDGAALTPKTLDDVKAGVAKNQTELFNKVVKFLENEKSIYRIFENYYITAGQYESYLSAVKDIISAKPSFSVIDFKDKTALSRKYAVAILEFFDKTGITVRKENDRFLK